MGNVLTFQHAFEELTKLYKSDIEKIHRTIHCIRRGELFLNSFDGLSTSDTQVLIKKKIQETHAGLDALIIKGKLIQDLQVHGFQYWNVARSGISKDCDEQWMKQIIFQDNPKKILLCFTDQLKQRFPTRWDELRDKILQEEHMHPQATIMYADFSYSSWPLEELKILLPEEPLLPRSPSVFTTITLEPEPLVEYINVLLLGESGVGKSTFINALANYLHFDSLEKAKTGQPVVVIPVSFILATGAEFEERSIKFGEIDPNENHNEVGQSVTQQCRSYLFQIAPGKKLRIIDTPGFADTRGFSQDQINMNIVFTFVRNLPHLNAVFLLHKPGVARLNPFLYACFTEIFEWFGEGIRDHLIFCFTNTRTTFFTPGDTGPLLRSFLKTFPVANIPFAKTNVFCFDSESFRYLVALQNDIKFDGIEEEEFVLSWTRSVKESERLRTSLCEVFRPYHRNVEWQSMKDAQCEINLLVRPILERIRNILRNTILLNTKCSIKLKATIVDHSTTICYKCERVPKQLVHFSDLTNHSSNECASNEFSPTEYRLNYEPVLDSIDQDREIWDEQKTLLCNACAQFTRFLLITDARKDDPFLTGLTRMGEEEKNICEIHQDAISNHGLVQLLDAFRGEYEKLLGQTHLNKDDQLLPTIYKLIQSINEIPAIKVQIQAIREYQQHILTSSERDLDAQTNN